MALRRQRSLLEEVRLRQGATSLVDNKDYLLYLSTQGGGFVIDPKKIERDRRFDGKWVLRTTSDLDVADVADVAEAYRQLWRFENIFRTMTSLLEPRPVFHRTDEAIQGHVFCSFLALRLRTEAKGVTGKVFQAVGVALPPTVRKVS